MPKLASLTPEQDALWQRYQRLINVKRSYGKPTPSGKDRYPPPALKGSMHYMLICATATEEEYATALLTAREDMIAWKKRIAAPKLSPKFTNIKVNI